MSKRNEVLSASGVRERAAEIDWWHTMDLGHGVITPGKDDTVDKLARIQFPDDLTGKTVLDIGAWDGFFSFEAERRGAQRVVALDWFTWKEGGRAGFDLAHQVFGSKVETIELPVEEMTVERVGTFDVVLFLGVLYHVADPLGIMIKIADVTREQLILETAADLLGVRRPALAFYPGTEGGDWTTWFAPNVAGCRALVQAVQFKRVEVVTKPPSAFSRILGRMSRGRLGSTSTRVAMHAFK